MASGRLRRTEHNIKNIVKSKREIRTFRIEHIIGEMELPPTDIIPIINKALGKVIC